MANSDTKRLIDGEPGFLFPTGRMAREQAERQRDRSLTPPPGAIIEGLNLVERNALRWIAGPSRRRVGEPARLFMPAPADVRKLADRGLVEPHPHHAGEHRPTEAGVALLGKIGPRG